VNGGDPEFSSEVLQQLRAHILVADGESPARLSQYSGQGALGAWLRVSAIRIAISLKRSQKNEVTLEEQFLAVAQSMDQGSPKHAVLRRLAKKDLTTTLRKAVASQSSRTRAILRLYYADGNGVEDIGRVYGVHASTVSRWLGAARQDILAALYREIREELQMTQAEAESLFGVPSSIELSIGGLLATVE
jgi:RNA polymerase sigma-70 factor (ECF subfamily)